MTNPFEQPDGVYQVLVNEENQHSLWPATLPVPAGWHPTHGPTNRDACLAYIEENWTDLRPKSLVDPAGP